MSNEHSLSKIYNLSETQNNIYEFQRKYIKQLYDNVKSVNYSKKTEYISKQLEFVRCFNTKGVQGIVGHIKIPNYPHPLIFKISVDINRSAEHEFFVMENCNNTLKDTIPHFVRSVGMLELPISEDFIREPYKHSLFELGGDMIPRTVIFIENIHKLPFYKLCDHILYHNFKDKSLKITDKNIISSQILQILMALHTGQEKHKFVHYDLHTANILIQKCEPNSHFLYITNNGKYLIPTYGFFPVLIDMGISYIDKLNGSYISFNLDNYDRGFQTSEYDPLHDIHHFLINSMYVLEYRNDTFDNICNKLKYLFRHIPILRKSGWKYLPYDLTESVIEKIRYQCKYYCQYRIFNRCEKESLEVLNGLIKLPLIHKNDEYDFHDCFPYFMEEVHKIIDIDYYSDNDCMFVLKIIVGLINSKTIEEFAHNLTFILKVVLDIDLSTKNINFKKMYLSAVVFGERLANMYSYMIKKHNKLINECYDKTVIKSVEDIIIYLMKHITPYSYLNYNDKIYIWNIKDNNNKQFILSEDKISLEDLDKLNMSNLLDKGEKLYQYL